MPRSKASITLRCEMNRASPSFSKVTRYRRRVRGSDPNPGRRRTAGATSGIAFCRYAAPLAVSVYAAGNAAGEAAENAAGEAAENAAGEAAGDPAGEAAGNDAGNAGSIGRASTVS